MLRHLLRCWEATWDESIMGLQLAFDEKVPLEVKVWGLFHWNEVTLLLLVGKGLKIQGAIASVVHVRHSACLMKTLNKFHSKKQGKSVALAAAEARPRLSRIC